MHNVVEKIKIELIEHDDTYILLTQNAYDKTNTMPKTKTCEEYDMICRCYPHIG